MKKRTMLPISDESAETCDRRVVIWRDDFPTCRADQGDHVFTMWGNHSRYDFSDSGAENPFEEIFDEEGFGTGEMKVRDGIFAFAVNLYDHSGLSFSLGGDPAHGFDPGGWDTTRGAAYLYCDREQFCVMQGEDRWMKVPTDPDDWDKPWREAKDEDEFRLLTLRPLAEQEVDEINLIEQGQRYGYREEHKEKWTKTYADGRTEEGYDWVEDDSCGGYLAECADDIDFDKDPDVPVFYEDDVFLYGDRKRGLGRFEFFVPEFIVRRWNPPCEKYQYLVKGYQDCSMCWTDDPKKAAVFHNWWKVQHIAQEFICKEDYDALKCCIRPEDAA